MDRKQDKAQGISPGPFDSQIEDDPWARQHEKGKAQEPPQKQDVDRDKKRELDNESGNRH
jgi:hypothetical protein